MRVLVTAGPTREPVDAVRFISNASSGRMGVAVACAAATAGHDVTLLVGPVSEDLLASARQAGCEVVRFTSVADLQAALEQYFDACDALIMAAAVGDFTVGNPSAEKLSRQAGPITITLTPTADFLAACGARKRPDQKIVAFAVETGADGDTEARAREKLIAKGADAVVLNPPGAMAAESSRACILAADAVLLPWAERPKEQLAREIVERLLE
jgi:phosphopantothenoylcysteine decarboxylase/phosphopantothenate--cysteine ligase